MREEIDSCKWFYLTDLREPRDNALRIVIEEALVGEAVQNLSGTFSASPIETGPLSRIFELTWHQYIAYTVTSESFAAVPDGEIFEGKLLRYYSKSIYLDYVRLSSTATDEWPGPFRHWQMLCLNHIVDVVAAADPEISILIRRSESTAH